MQTILLLPKMFAKTYIFTRGLGALRALTSSWKPFGPLDFVLLALRALRTVRRACLSSGPVKKWHFLKIKHFVKIWHFLGNR